MTGSNVIIDEYWKPTKNAEVIGALGFREVRERLVFSSVPDKKSP